MIDRYISKVLLNLQESIEANPLVTPEPLGGDKWILASTLQKTIRRGEVDCALRAAYGLWLQDRQSFWRRLHIASIEDVGIANLDLIVDTLTATSSSLWRRKFGDLRVGLHLTKRLCLSPKTRIADEILLAAERSNVLTQRRIEFARANDDELISIITDHKQPVIERCLAAWYLAGFKRYLSDFMPTRTGQPEYVAEVLHTLGAPAKLVGSCIAVMGMTRWPLSIFTPIIWNAANKHKTETTTIEKTFEHAKTVNGIPLYACDMFTRTGQTSYRRLQKEVKDLQNFSVKQIGIGVFYLEGGLLDQTLSSTFFDDCRLHGEIADAEHVGLSIPEYMALRDVLRREWKLLDELRSQQLQRSFYGSETERAN